MTTMGLEFLKLEEQKRTNLANEGLKRETNRETARHNIVTEDQSQQQIIEANRHNVATETETRRSNLAKETETYRSNLAKETETNRANVAKETETQRHNKYGEKLTTAGQYGGYAKFDMLNQLSGNTNNAMGFLAPIDALLYNFVSGSAPGLVKLLK